MITDRHINTPNYIHIFNFGYLVLTDILDLVDVMDYGIDGEQMSFLRIVGSGACHKT